MSKSVARNENITDSVNSFLKISTIYCQIAQSKYLATVNKQNE
jgi:hypothetical protein